MHNNFDVGDMLLSNYVRGENYETNKQHILYAAAISFLEYGYTATTIKKIAADAKTNTGTLQNIFKTKDDILSDIVAYVLEGQFDTTAKFLEGITDDKILFYAAETTLQLYMAESSENIRSLYAAAYSLPKTTQIIQNTITKKLEYLFKEHLPEMETKDFYMLEIASGGIMRNFMMVPCDMWFTMEQKIEAFLETTFRVYCVPEEKIREAVEFVSRFDYNKIAGETIDTLLAFLKDEIA